MIKVEIIKNEEKIQGISSSGHAFYNDYGQDIVCAGVSSLVFNTINSIKSLLDLDLPYTIDEKNNSIEINNIFTDEAADLLMASLELGLINIAKEYPKHIVIEYKEV